MKSGNELRISGEVKLDDVLVDLTAWTIRADLRRDSETGVVIGSFTVTKPSTGVYVGVINTTGLPNVAVYTDVRLIAPGGGIIVTETLNVVLTPAVTA